MFLRNPRERGECSYARSARRGVRRCRVSRLVERFDIEPFSDFSANYQTLEGSFSSVSKPIFATKYSFFSILRDLQDLHTFAPLQTQNLRKSSSNFFRMFARISAKILIFRQFSTKKNFAPILMKFSRNFAKYLRNFLKFRKFPNFCGIPTNFPEF